LAGGASDETGVRLDGHPLQDPFHLLGLLGAFNVAALDRADVLIHHLPPALGGSLSGVVAMRTRAPSAAPLREATVSLLSGGVTLGGGGLPGGIDVLAAARTTYLDRVAASVAPDLPRAGFRDALVRLGRSWGGWRGELLGFTTNDRYADADFAEVAAYDPLQWGESMVGARLDREAAGARLALRASYNVAGSHLDERAAGGANFIDSERGWLSAAAEGELSREAWRAQGGVAVDAREHTQRWVARGLIDEVFSPNTPAEYEGTEAVTVAAVHGEGSLRLGSCLTATLGARVSVTSEGAFPAPSALLTCEPRSGLRLEAAVERRHQFAAQLEEPIEGSISPPIFLLARPRIADVAAVSTAWSAAWGELGAQLFTRRYPDRTRLPARAPGAERDEIGRDFPAFERVTGSAAGLALRGTASGLNRVAQGSYTFQRAGETFDGSTTPTGWDAPHALSLLVSAALGRRWIGSTVYQARSGRATTPVRARIFEPDLRVADSNSLVPRYLYGERNSIRVPAY
ncbi:MAG TPA: hypothetical protein VE913_04155, partial [Longimicrobium sp.]|nr:hypothetical protein [Longimicrobium sp.]